MKQKLGVKILKEKLIVANWKMNKNVQKTKEFAEIVGTEVLKSKNKIVICPPFTSLYVLKTYADIFGFEVGAQNCFWENSGAFTGEVSPSMLSDLGCKYVILGHSERRNYFDETNELINKKIAIAIENNLIPIVCVGESSSSRENGSAIDFVLSQLVDCFCGVIANQMKRIVIAYEPIWSIGTGKAMNPQQAQEMCSSIRKFILKKYDEKTASEVKILYGGSVTPENSKNFFEMQDIDGGLIGGASLDAEKFVDIISF